MGNSYLLFSHAITIMHAEKIPAKGGEMKKPIVRNEENVTVASLYVCFHKFLFFD